ncbi:DinB family protein [Gluconobacter cerinus]|nr:DinB family protein [Gluconobacter cerinus]OUJ07602.1 damage-inducible protein DinB [Gluconobacter sp. DsW_058]
MPRLSSPPHLQTLIMFLEYRVWADRLTYDALLKLPQSEIVKPRQTTFSTLLGTLNHVYVVDDIFRHHLQGQDHGYRSRQTDEVPDLEALWQATQSMHQWYLNAVMQWSVDDLSCPISFTYVDGQPGVMTREQIILHVVNHATYHRGFVGDMLKQIPESWPSNDLTVFLRDEYQRSV